MDIWKGNQIAVWFLFIRSIFYKILYSFHSHTSNLHKWNSLHVFSLYFKCNKTKAKQTVQLAHFESWCHYFFQSPVFLPSWPCLHLIPDCFNFFYNKMSRPADIYFLSVIEEKSQNVNICNFGCTNNQHYFLQVLQYFRIPSESCQDMFSNSAMQ